MLLTIHNLPAATRYADVKSLLQSKCGLQQVILDNLVGDGSGKKVTVGVAEDADAAILVRKINGLYWNGQQLYVEDVRRQKSASEQPYRSTMPEDEQPFRPMNPQQHSNFPKAVPMPTEMAPAMQPMMAMYYVPDYTNQEYMQSVGMQANFMQNFDQNQKVQNAFPGVGNISQGMLQAGMSQYNQDFSSSEAQNQSLPWEEAYNEAPNYSDRPGYGQSANKRKSEWSSNRRESPSRDDRVQPWAGGNDTRARPAQSDFRPNFRPDDRSGFKQPRTDFRPDDRSGFKQPRPDFRPDDRSGFKQPRPDFRPDDRSGFKQPRPDFRSNDRPGLLPKPAQPNFGANQGRPNRFTGPQEFPEAPNKRQRTDEGFARSNEFERPNERCGPNEFSGRPNARRGPNEFSRGPNDFGGQNNRRESNEFTGGQNEFSGRPNDFSGPNDRHGRNEFSGRQNERRGPNEFSGRPNEFSGRPNEFSEGPNARRGPNNFSGGMNERGKPNEHSGRSNDRRGPNQFSEKPNLRRGPNDFSGKPNKFSGGPNDFSGRRNDNQRRPNDRPGISKPNREFGRPNQRDGYRSVDHPKFEAPRKRKFEQRIEEPQRPQRVSRPKIRDICEMKPSDMDDETKERMNKRLFTCGVRKIVYQIRTNLGLPPRGTDLETRQMLKNLITDRLESILDGRTLVQPMQCYDMYRSMYPEMGDKTTYDTAMAMVSKKNDAAAKGGVVPKPVAKEVTKPAAKPAVKPAAKPAPEELPKKITKSEREAIRKRKEAEMLLAQGKLPSFPQGDKRKVAQQRKEEKEGYIPEVEPKYKVAIDEELEKIGDVFIEGLNSAPTSAQQRACDTVNKTLLVEDIQLLLLQNLSRRISNTGLKVVRIFGYPKLPTRAVLEKAVFKLGIQSLRKSTKSKMYAAAVDTYENLDKLCTMEHLEVEGGIVIAFKPFHLAIKERADQKVLKTMRKKIIKEMIDTTDLNLLDKDWPAKEAEIKAKQEAEAAAKAALKEAKAAKDAEAKAAKDVEANTAKDADTAKTAEVEGEKTEAKVQEKETLDEVQNDDTANDSKNATDYLNDDFHVIDEVNETDSDVEFSGDVIEAFDLNSDGENNGNGVENDGDVDESNTNVDESGGNIDESNDNVDESNYNDENNEMDDIGDENDFDIDNVDELNEDDLEDY